jgi:hypothetical protein
VLLDAASSTNRCTSPPERPNPKRPDPADYLRDDRSPS